MQPGKIQIGNKIFTGQTVFQGDENGNYVGTVVIITHINNTQSISQVEQCFCHYLKILGGALLFSLVPFINNNLLPISLQI